MASGCKNCNTIDSNSCTDIISSSCVLWMGDPFEDLEICKGDTLTEVLDIVLDKLDDVTKGLGITIGYIDYTDCTFLDTIKGSSASTLETALTTFFTAICQLKASADAAATLAAGYTSTDDYTLGCLSPLADPCDGPIGFHTLIQAIITKLCALNTQFESIADTIMDITEEIIGNFIIAGGVKSAGGNGITYTGTGATGKAVITALVPPNSPILYIGSTSFFDGSGVGLPNTPYEGWYLCNGNNGTPNSSGLPQNLAANLVYIIRFT